MANLETKETTALMQGIAESINKFLEMFFGEKIGFCIHIFEFEKDQSVCRYVSNAERKYMIETLRKSADDLEVFDTMEKNKTVGRC